MAMTFAMRWVAMAGLAAGFSFSAAAADAAKPIRIDAGASIPAKDADGNDWLADTGFDGGDTVDRGAIAIGETKSPAIYRTERYGMKGFSYTVPNGPYTVKLHFAETYEGITGADGRVFGVAVNGAPSENVDVFKEAGGANKALVKTYKTEAKDGKIAIVFKTIEEKNLPEINGIELIPDAPPAPAGGTASAGAAAPAGAVKETLPDGRVIFVIPCPDKK